MNPTGFPLSWPDHWRRTPPEQRRTGSFAKRDYNGPLKDITVGQAVERLIDEFKKFGIPDYQVIVSTNIQPRLDGMPRSGQAEPNDPGAAVYWNDCGQKRCMAIDRYSRVAQNIAALAATIEAMRSIERHGGAVVLERAFAGFLALPAPLAMGIGFKRPWRQVLGFPTAATVNRAMVESRFRKLASENHPDKGGDDAKMAELNAARIEALEEVPE